MKVSSEIMKWLEENAYAMKNGDYWFLTDFPKDQIPYRLEIPMNKMVWKAMQEELK